MDESQAGWHTDSSALQSGTAPWVETWKTVPQERALCSEKNLALGENELMTGWYFLGVKVRMQLIRKALI